MDLDLKKDFKIFEKYPDLVYLDAASTSLVPHSVVQAVSAFLDDVVVSSRRGAYSLAAKGAEITEKTRRHMAGLLRTSPSQISFHGTIADAAASLILGYDWKGNNRNTIVVGASEEHDTLVMALRAAEILGLEVRVCPIDSTGSLDIDKMSDLVDRGVGIVIANTHPVGVGTVNPIHEISNLAHENDALVLSDATRGVGISELTPRDTGADIILFSANVAYLAPPGLMVQWIDASHGSSFRPGIVGDNSVTGVTPTSFELALMPDKFESGMLNVPAIAGLDAALYYLESIGLDLLNQHLQTLSKKLWDELSDRQGIQLYGNYHTGKTVFGFNIGSEESLSCHDVALFLDQSSICVRSGLLCAHPLVQSVASDGMVQVSLHVYNTQNDITRLIEAIDLIMTML